MQAGLYCYGGCAMDEKIRFFRELLSSVTNMYFTTLDAEYNLLYSDTAHLEVFFSFFRLGMKYDEMLNQVGLSELDTSSYRENPVFCTNSVGMAWISDIEYKRNKVEKIHMIGPVFLDDYSIQSIEKGLDHLQLTVKMRHEFMDVIKELPVISINRFYEYGIMLHYCLTGHKIGVADFVYADDMQDIPEQVLEEKHGIYMTETNILKLIEDGNLGYKKEMEKYKGGEVGKFSKGDYLRQAKNSVIIFCALCARSAIKGGITPEIAYVLRDQYIQKAESAESIAAITKVNQLMLDDYVHRVHHAKKNTDISPAIRESCDYITLHLNEKWDIHFLAAKQGYSDYYFSEKFKKETGLSVRAYTIKKKIEKAQEYLRHSNMSVQEISDEFGFSSQSHFGRVFREETGISPGEYRTRNKAYPKGIP